MVFAEPHRIEAQRLQELDLLEDLSVIVTRTPMNIFAVLDVVTDSKSHIMHSFIINIIHVIHIHQRVSSPKIIELGDWPLLSWWMDQPIQSEAECSSFHP